MQEAVNDPGRADRGDEGIQGSERRRIDRRRDVAAWITTPVVTLLIGPVVGLCTAAAVVGLSTGGPLISCTGPDDCYHAQTLLLEQDAAVFLVGWLLLWCLPWWRGLRRLRIIVAALTVLPLILLPIHLLSLPS